MALAGPKGSLVFGNLTEFGKDPLLFLQSCVQSYGDVVQLRFLHRPVLLLNNPTHIEQVLTSFSKNFTKTVGYRTSFMRRIFGQGLLTSEGELWTRQRRLAQPAFHRERIANYAHVIAQFSQEMLNSWESGSERDVHEDVMKLTTRVVVKTLFNAEVPPSISQLGDASKVVLEQFTQQWSIWRLLKMILPSPGSRQFAAVIDDLDRFIFGLIQDRRASGQDPGDLLSMLIQTRDESGGGMSDQQLRDELITLMVAGLDTTALAVSWSLYLLAKNPENQRQLLHELDLVLAGRVPAFTDLPQLRYTEAVVKEAMRLYPPAWVIGREAQRDCNFGDLMIPRGTSVLMSQWLKHRDHRYFPSPVQFQPERWLGDGAKSLPRFAYFPFGGGPRVCIGSSFAMMEAQLTLASILRRFRVACEPGYEAVPWASITLQPKSGIRLQLTGRS